MQGVSKVILLGNVGRKPELKYTPSQHAVCEVRVATNAGSKEKPVTHWHSVTLWEKLAESASKYLEPGTPVYIEGTLGYQEYQNKEGQKVKKTVVTGYSWQFVDGGKPRSEGVAAPAPAGDDSDL